MIKNQDCGMIHQVKIPMIKRKKENLNPGKRILPKPKLFSAPLFNV